MLVVVVASIIIVVVDAMAVVFLALVAMVDVVSIKESKILGYL